MCGIIISDLTIPNDFKFIQNRGPDATNSVQYNWINFVHFLLHLTGEKTIQPIINDNCFDNFYTRDIFFRNKNIKSYALEFQGHGKSEGPKCLINDFNDLVENIRVLVEYLNQRYPIVDKYLCQSLFFINILELFFNLYNLFSYNIISSDI